MKTLRQTRDELLTVGSPDKVLLLADKYLQQMEELGDDFRLPGDHAFLRPILEHYYEDLEGWVKFIKGVRDRLPPRSEESGAVSAVYRTVSIRLVQRERRVRIDKAVTKAIEKQMIEPKYVVKVAYGNKCVQKWKIRRDQFLKGHRRESKTGRLSQDVQEKLLQEFWNMIDMEIENGEVPKP